MPAPEQRRTSALAPPDPFSPLTLPCGRVIRNRLVKVALYEHMASLMGGPPNALHHSLYSQWAAHDWGMLISGNVQISGEHLSMGRDMLMSTNDPSLLDTEHGLKPWRELATAMHNDSDGRTLALLQLSHAGRQSLNVLGGRKPFAPPLAPSDVPVGASSRAGIMSHAFNKLAFQRPRAMETSDIDDVVNSFAASALFASKAGFDGVQLHAAHGYLLAQFASPKSNRRTDEYAYSPENALKLLHRIVKSIRAVVPSEFVLGIKLNAADYVGHGCDMTNLSDNEILALHHVREIAIWGGVDFIEVSGGDYEDPHFVSTSQSQRQAFFARFSHNAVKALRSDAATPTTPERNDDGNTVLAPEEAIRQSTFRPSPFSHRPSSISHNRSSITPPPLILLTGGLRTPSILYAVLANGHADLLGIGRASILCPDLPQVLRRFRLKSERDVDDDLDRVDNTIGGHSDGIIPRRRRDDDGEGSTSLSLSSSSSSLLSSSLLDDNDDNDIDGVFAAAAATAAAADPRMDQPFMAEPAPVASSSALAMIAFWLLDRVRPFLPRIELLGAGVTTARYTVYMRQLAVEGLGREDEQLHRTTAFGPIGGSGGGAAAAKVKLEPGAHLGPQPPVLSVDRPAPEYMSPLVAILYMLVWTGPPSARVDGEEEGGDDEELKQNRRSRWYYYPISTAIVIVAAITVLVRHHD